MYSVHLLALLLELHLTKKISLIVILRLFICWLVAWGHVLHKVHGLSVVLDEVMRLLWTAFERRVLLILVAWCRWIEWLTLQSKHRVVGPLVSKVYLIR